MGKRMTMGRRKAETPAQRTARLERERPANLFILVLLVGVVILGFHVCQFSRRSLYTNLFFTLLHKAQHVHTILFHTFFFL